MHYWHDLSVGKNPPHLLNAVVEISAGSKVKYELDKETGLIKVDRILYSSMHYPLNYGFVPRTYCPDKDPLDILIIAQAPFLPGSLVSVRPLGTIVMVDGGEQDDKVIGVCADDPEYAHLTSLKQFSPHKLKEVRNFFEDYKKLQEKQVEVGETLEKKATLKLIKDSVEAYKEQFLHHKKS